MISLVMTTFNRPNQLHRTLESIRRQLISDLEIIVVDDGMDDITPQVCRLFGATYFKICRPLTAVVRTPAVPNNFGIRHSHGDIVVLQNAECMHIDPRTIEKLGVRVTDNNAVFARVIALHADGSVYMTYCGQDNPRPYFFCGAMKRSWFEKLRGFDEDFTDSGYDDEDFGTRLRHVGVALEFTDIEVHHQWHPSGGRIDYLPVRALYNQKCLDMAAGKISAIRNLDHEWGVCPIS
jgi:glycosyltransferase involved in cell wall biosynthesis